MSQSRTDCNFPIRPGDIRLRDLDMDETDFAVLTAARFFFMSFSDASGSPWLTMFLSTEDLFPGLNSAETMCRLLAVVHEMRLSRKSTMQFSNPRCERCTSIITEEERHLIQMIQAIRENRISRAASSAMLLCEGNEIDELLRLVERFSRQVPARKGVTEFATAKLY